MNSQTYYVSLIRPLIDAMSHTPKKVDKIRVGIAVFRRLNTIVPEAVENTGLYTWIPFIATMFVKTTEFKVQEETGDFDDVDINLRVYFSQEYNTLREWMKGILINNPHLRSDNRHVVEAMKEINKEFAMDVDE